MQLRERLAYVTRPAPAVPRTPRTAVLPPGVSAERVAALRKAFVAAFNDKTLRAEADKMQLDVDPMSGDELQKLVADLYDTPPRLVERARLALTMKAQRC